MRHSFAATIHLAKQRAHLADRIQADDVTPAELKAYAKLTDQVINGLIDEMKFMAHDISMASASASRSFR